MTQELPTLKQRLDKARYEIRRNYMKELRFKRKQQRINKQSKPPQS